MLNPENFSQGHLMWNDDLFSEAQPLWEAARAHGLRRGVTQYLMLPNRALGFLSFSRCSAREIPILSDELQLKMQLLVRESLMALMRLNDEIVMTPEMNFSKRKRNSEMDGGRKTSAEIAMILSISENTVNFHQKNMQKKSMHQIRPGCLLRGRYWLNLISFLSACQMQKPAERHALSRFYITDGRLV